MIKESGESNEKLKFDYTLDKWNLDMLGENLTITIHTCVVRFIGLEKYVHIMGIQRAAPLYIHTYTSTRYMPQCQQKLVKNNVSSNKKAFL